MVHLCGFRLNRICKTWASSEICLLKSSTFGTYNLHLYLITPFPLGKNVSMDFISTDSFKSIKIGWGCFLNFTSTTKEELDLCWTMKSPFGESTSLLPTRQTYEHHTLTHSSRLLHESHYPWAYDPQLHWLSRVVSALIS